MEKWRVVGKIVTVFGIIFLLFAAFAAFLEYQILSYQYGSIAPAGFIQVNTLSAMLPYLTLASLSFVVSAFTRRLAGEPVAIEETPLTTHPQDGTTPAESKL